MPQGEVEGASLALVVTVCPRVKGGECDVARIEAWIDGRSRRHGADEQAGGGEQDERAGHLRDDQTTGCQRPSPPTRGGRLQQRHRIAACAPKRRDDAEEEADGERHGEREEQDAHVGRQLERQALVGWDRQTLERAGANGREQGAAESAKEKEGQRFGEELADETSAAGAESRTDPHLSTPSRCSHRK